MKLSATLGLLLVTAGAAIGVAQRIYTNPKPQNLLPRLFPGAVAFSPLEGTPLHFRAYAVDPKAAAGAEPIGFAFWTTDLVPREEGYHGPIHILVGLDTAGVITGAIVDYSAEPYGYFSVETPGFAAQFTGKSVRDPFKVGGDIDAVSRATISVSSGARAVRDSSRAIAKAFLRPEALKR